MEPWTEVVRHTPQIKPYRTRCTDEGCALALSPVEFVDRNAAETWAQSHANASGHVTVTELRWMHLGVPITLEDHMCISKDGP